MKTEIKPDALYWASFNRFEMRLPGQCVLDCSHSGPCDEVVAYWVPQVEAMIEADGFPNRPTPDAIRKELAEQGSWDAKELADDAANMARLVWIAAGNISEEPQLDESAPIKGHQP